MVWLMAGWATWRWREASLYSSIGQPRQNSEKDCNFAVKLAAVHHFPTTRNFFDSLQPDRWFREIALSEASLTLMQL
jgi:hypothetical protein